MKRVVWAVTLSAAALLIPAQAFAQKVNVDFDPAAQFSSYKTCGGPGAPSLIHLAKAHPRGSQGRMAAKGLSPTADVMIATHVVTKRKIISRLRLRLRCTSMAAACRQLRQHHPGTLVLSTYATRPPSSRRGTATDTVATRPTRTRKGQQRIDKMMAMPPPPPKNKPPSAPLSVKVPSCGGTGRSAGVPGGLDVSAAQFDGQLITAISVSGLGHHRVRRRSAGRVAAGPGLFRENRR